MKPQACKLKTMDLTQLCGDNPWTTVLLILLSVIFFILLKVPRNLPPGPRGLPFIGAPSELSQSMHLDFQRLGRKYGEIVSLYAGNTLMIGLNSHRIIKEAFVTRRDEFADRPSQNTKDLVNSTDRIFVPSYSRQWNEDKKFALKAFRAFGVGSKSLEDKIQQEVDHLADILHREDGRPINISEYLAKAAGNVICSILFSARYDFDDPESNRVLEVSRGFLDVLANTFVYIESVPLFVAKIIYRKHCTALQNSCETARDFVRDHVARHKITFDPSHLRDFLDVYIKEEKLDEDAFVDTILSFLPDATDTLALVILWSLLYVTLDENLQTKIQQEIHDVTGGTRKVALQDKGNMPFTEATILETLRKSSTAAMAIFHKPKHNTSLGGYHIPENSAIFANIYAAHMDENVWKDPNEFRPKRFLDSSGKVVKTDDLIPFSAGRRTCLGEQLTKVEVFLFLTNLLQRFTFSFPLDRPKPSMEAEKPELLIRKPPPFEFCVNPH